MKIIIKRIKCYLNDDHEYNGYMSGGFPSECFSSCDKCGKIYHFWRVGKWWDI